MGGPSSSRAATECTMPVPGQERFIPGTEPQAGAAAHGRRGDLAACVRQASFPRSPRRVDTPGRAQSLRRSHWQRDLWLWLFHAVLFKVQALVCAVKFPHHGNRAPWVPPHCWHSRIDLTLCEGLLELTPSTPAPPVTKQCGVKEGRDQGPSCPAFMGPQSLSFLDEEL